VGSLSTRQEALLGSILATYMDSPDNLIVISTDFCHFGQRYSNILLLVSSNFSCNRVFGVSDSILPWSTPMCMRTSIAPSPRWIWRRFAPSNHMFEYFFILFLQFSSIQFLKIRRSNSEFARLQVAFGFAKEFHLWASHCFVVPSRATTVSQFNYYNIVSYSISFS
jgi:hypothetical protein